MTGARPDTLLPTPALGMLLLTLGLIVAPHAAHLPLWLTVLVLTCGIWRYLRAVRGESLPPDWLRVLLTVTTAAGIFASYGSLLGRDAGTALLVGMAGLKLLEMRSRRDTHVVLYLGFVLIATQFLYDQSILTALYLFITVWAMVMILIAAHRATDHGHPWQYARLAGSMMLQALPLMLVLFVLFPRISGPLWRTPEDGRASTGLSDTMSPGSISQLSRSDEVAFRVLFDGNPPPRRQRYWRALVLSDYDGRTWSTGQPGSPAALADTGEVLSYSVLLEPHQQRWIPALELLSQAPPATRLSGAHELSSTQRIREIRRFELSSSLEYRYAPELSAAARAANLRLPNDAHPTARALAREWQRDGADSAAILARAEAYFRSQPFVYTLTPPALPEDAVDQFLFDTRRGFCEHYANAFTVLMRAAGVPARVVTGYQGGEMNPVGDYLIVRQSDAHAWSEVWLEGRGWQRVDPTGWVALQRIELGLDQAVGADEPVPFLARQGGGIFKALRLRLDALTNGWNRWVLAYGPELQQQLLSRAGLRNWQQIALALGASLVAVVLGVALAMFFGQRRRRIDPVLASYQRFCHKLARRGLPRAPSEGPEDYARRVVQARPELGPSIDTITRLYVKLRYGHAANPAWQRRLRQLVQGFRP